MTNMVKVLSAGLIFSVALVGCGRGGPGQHVASERRVSVPASEALVGQIELPADATVDGSTLASYEDLTYDALIFSVASAIFGDGRFATGTVTALDSEIDDLGVELTGSTIELDEVFVGGEGVSTVRVTSAVEDLALDIGTSYLFVIGPLGDNYTFTGAMLFDRTDGEWSLRPSEVDVLPEPVELADSDISRVVDEANAYVAQRERARAAEIELAESARGAGGEANHPSRSSQPKSTTIAVTGHLPGETMELVFCDVSDPSFLPTDFQSCDSATSEWITTDSEHFEIQVTFPTHLDLGGEEPVACAVVRCALVASDTGWPNEVFATYER